MKKLVIIWLFLASCITACVPYIYGVPQETWGQMSEAERIEAIRVYEREQQVRRQAAEARARRDAMEREREKARQVALERERRERIEAIHRGEGAYGELIRVRLQGGRIKVGDRHHRYEPINFTIADGETRKLGVADSKGREVDFVATYAGGALSLDGLRFPYERRWGQGTLYADTGTSGPLQLRGVDLFIEIHERSSRFERELPRLVLVREEAHQHYPHFVEIILASGEIKVAGKRHVLERSFVRLAEGESREFPVKAGHEKRVILLHYSNGELMIDGTPANARDAVRLPFDKEWKTGKTYRLNLKGRVPMEQVEVRVRGIDR